MGAGPGSAVNVHWLASLPTPYNTHLMQALDHDPDIRLMVHYRHDASASHPWRSALREGFVSRILRPVLGVDWALLVTALRERNAYFVVAGWNHLTANLLLATLMLFGRRFAVWTDTPDVQKRRPWPMRWLRAWWLRRVFAKAERVMGTGRTALQALHLMGAAQGKLVNLPYFVDVARCRERKRDVPVGQPLRFVSSGRLINLRKGHDLALRALVMASRKTGVPFEYTIAGVGPDETALKRLTKDLGVESCVQFPGWLEPDELIDLMQNSDVLLHPSPTHEPYGVAILEGMACGLPVLASDACGAAVDRIEHGVNGFVHRAGDVVQLAEHISALLADSAILRDMGCGARATTDKWPVERGVAIIKDVCLAHD